MILGTAYSQPCPLSDNNVDCIPADYKWHAIKTAVKSDPADGTLWVGNGDTHASSVDAARWRPYDEGSLAGKIMHIDRNGRGLADHPFCPPMRTSSTSVRRSTPRGSETRSGSRSGRARARWSAMSATSARKRWT